MKSNETGMAQAREDAKVERITKEQIWAEAEQMNKFLTREDIRKFSLIALHRYAKGIDPEDRAKTDYPGYTPEDLQTLASILEVTHGWPKTKE